MTDRVPGAESFISRLVELRDRLVKAAAGIAIFCIALMIWPGPAMLALAIPMCLLFEPGLLVAPVFVKATQAPEEAAWRGGRRRLPSLPRRVCGF